jgi:subtilase family serine protease
MTVRLDEGGISMTAKTRLWAALIILTTLAPGYAHAQATVRLQRSVSPAAKEIPNAAQIADAMPMEITVRLALHNTAALEQLKLDQQDPSSPSYHKWLTPAQFNARFGPTEADADAVAQWLSSEGFTIKAIDLAQHVVTATASAGVVGQALDTTIVSNGTLFANTTDPAIPAAIAPLVINIDGLNNIVKAVPATPENFRPLSDADTTEGSDASPTFNGPQGLGFSPQDFRTYYNEASLIAGGNSGAKAPDCIGLAATSDIHSNTFGAFTKKFALPPVKVTKIYASGGSPGFNDAEVEADLDVEYSHALSPATPIRVYVGAGSNDLQDAITRSVSDGVCGAVSISFSYCTPSGSLLNALHATFNQATTQGQSVFISSGDEGSAGLTTGCAVATFQTVNEMCADPNVTCVGGTQFSPSYDSKGKDTSTIHTALESVWNDGIGATGGGVSTFFARPAYQVGTGVPAGSMRLVPDVSLGASPILPGYYVVAFSRGKNLFGTIGGTSLSSPAWAGYSRLIANAANDAKLGALNPQIYKIGNMGSSAGLIDVLTGNNSFNFLSGFAAGPGYDEATGWGSPDMSLALVSLLSGGTAVATPASISDPPKTVITNAGVLTLTNTSTASLTVNSITVSISRAAIFKSLSMTVGAQTITPKKGSSMVFNFSPVTIPVSGNAVFTLGATMAPKALAGSPASTQTVGALGVKATVSGASVTFQGLPESLGTITLTH